MDCCGIRSCEDVLVTIFVSGGQHIEPGRVGSLGNLLSLSLPARHVGIALAILIRGRQVLSISRSSPLRVLRTVEEMGFLAIQSLDGACPVATVNALYGLALMLGFNGFELGMRVVVWWSRHRRDCLSCKGMSAGDGSDMMQCYHYIDRNAVCAIDDACVKSVSERDDYVEICVGNAATGE